MRNVVTTILEPNGFLFVRLREPLQAHEKPTVLTFVKTGLVIQMINPRSIFLKNLSPQSMPLFFAVTAKDFSFDWIGGLVEARKLLLGDKT